MGCGLGWQRRHLSFLIAGVLLVRFERIYSCEVTQLPVSRQTGEVEASTHMDGYRVNQDLAPFDTARIPAGSDF